MKGITKIIFTGMIFLGAGCATQDLRTQNFTVREFGMEGKTKNASFAVFHFSATTTWDCLFDAATPRTVRSWRTYLDVPFTVNATYFTASGTPSGFFQTAHAKSLIPFPSLESQKKETGYTGALAIKDGHLSLGYLPDLAIDRSAETLLLTYPTLLASSTVKITKDSGLTARRTVFAQQEDGSVDVFVSLDGGITLFDMAHWLHDAAWQYKVHYVTAVNMDGGPSTGASSILPKQEGDIASVPIPDVCFTSSRFLP